jgi:hypothetical protein
VITVRPPSQLQGPRRLLTRTRGLFTLAGKLPARLIADALTSHADHLGLLLDTVWFPNVRLDLTAASGETGYLAACCHADPGGTLGNINHTRIPNGSPLLPCTRVPVPRGGMPFPAAAHQQAQHEPQN